MKWDGGRGEGNPIGWWGHLVTEKTIRTLMCRTGGVDKEPESFETVPFKVPIAPIGVKDSR